MKTLSQAKETKLKIKAKIAGGLCREHAIECGYAALAAAIEGKAWERHRYLNLMRRFVFCEKSLDRLVSTRSPILKP